MAGFQNSTILVSEARVRKANYVKDGIEAMVKIQQEIGLRDDSQLYSPFPTILSSVKTLSMP